MNEKISKAHENIEGVLVAEIISDFWREFKDVYGLDVMSSTLCAVGPLQSMIGLAIKNGHLELKQSQKVVDVFGGPMVTYAHKDVPFGVRFRDFKGNEPVWAVDIKNEK